MNKEIKINYLSIALAEQQLRTLAASINEEIVLPTSNSKGELVDELEQTVASINRFRVQLVEIIEKTASALNNVVVSFKKADEGISYKG